MDHRAWKSSVPEQFDHKADTPDVELPQPELAEAESILNAKARIFSSSLPVYGHPTTLSGAETRFRSAPATTGADGIMTVDDNGTIESFNEAAEKIFSYARSEIIGRHVSTVLDAPSSPLTSAMSRRGRARARFTIPAGVVGKRRDGSSFSVELTSADINLRNKQRLVLVVRDASERNRAEAERSRAEARYRSLVEQIPAVTFMGSLNDDLIDFYVSPQIEMLLGFSQEEWLSDPFLWFNQLHPDDRKLCNDEFARGCMTGGPFAPSSAR
jgi:PAS domain S-box-containing protein